MKSYVTCLSVIFGAHLASLIISDHGGSNIAQLFFVVLLIQGVANTFLHFAFCASGRVAPFALPLMWVSCLLPLYIYCFYVMPAPRFGGRDLAFVVLGLFILAPAIVISFITALIFFLRRKFQK